MAKGWLDGLWSARFADYLGRAVDITVAYNPANLNIVAPGMQGTRDPACLFAYIWIGRPDGTLKIFPIPAGDFNLTAGQLNAQGYGTIEELTAANVTIGPAG